MRHPAAATGRGCASALALAACCLAWGVGRCGAATPASLRCPDDLELEALARKSYSRYTITPNDAWWAQKTAEDSCTISCSHTGTFQYTVGETEVVFLSSCGPTCTARVVVTDAEAPYIACPYNGRLVTKSDPGKYATELALDAATYTDNHRMSETPLSAAVAGTPAAIREFRGPGGGVVRKLATRLYTVGLETTVTFTAQDETGNTQSCDVVVEVLDRERPRMACPTEALVAESDAGLAGAKLGSLVLAQEFSGPAELAFWQGGSGGRAVFFTHAQLGVTDNAPGKATLTAEFQHESQQAVGPQAGARFIADSESGGCSLCRSTAADSAADPSHGCARTSTCGTGTLLPIGLTQITVRASDGSHNVASCTMQLHVKDKEKHKEKRK